MMKLATSFKHCERRHNGIVSLVLTVVLLLLLLLLLSHSLT
jgi:hypothetical protein